MTAGTRQGSGTGLHDDPAVPARELLLDPVRVLARLADGLGAAAPLPLVGAEQVRVKYRVGESLRVTYRLHLAGGGALVAAARTFPTAERARRAAGVVPPPVDGRRQVWCDPDDCAVWWVYPHDRRLRGLADLDGDSSALSPFVPDGAARGELVALAPGSGAVLRVVDRAGVTHAYAKVYGPGAPPVGALAARYALVRDRMAEDPAVLVPQVLAADQDRDLLVLEAVPGRAWTALGEQAADRAVAALGGAVARLHGTSVPRPRAAGLRDFARVAPRRVRRSAEVVARARPDLAPALEELAGDLLRGRPRRGARVLLHGDCHPGNLLAGEHGVSLIDLDQAGLGPAGADVGSMLARLLVGGLVGERAPGDTAVLVRSFLAGYADVRPLPPDEALAWSVAAALLVERALRAVNRVHRPVLARLDEVVDLARQVRTGGLP